MRVLLTNDDGIDADGLQALRRALLEVPGIDLHAIAPDGNRSAIGRGITTRRPLVRRAGRLRRRRPRLRDRRHAGRLRAPGGARARRRLDAEIVVARHQPRREPRRRRDLLRHRRRGVRGPRPRACRRSPSPSSPRRARWTSAWAASSPSSTAARFAARLVEELDDVPLPPSTLLNVNVPAGEPDGRRGRAAGQADLPRPAQARRGARARAAPLLDLRRRSRASRTSRAPTSPPSTPGASPSPRCTST